MANTNSIVVAAIDSEYFAIILRSETVVVVAAILSCEEISCHVMLMSRDR